ncbi:RNA polymerase sigma factor [Paenibacillus sp. 453mf]|uniref:RNA polymerase sigma factor n=1 Tax=Paenibacillus sp. 453mf TaxID=1761874 RepID=UPI0008E5D7E5|nr:RNA polymerase sigma factor [Paenibacillus sp. 453mf]SFS57691.1 RNA polymerase sigma-70 factor, ECF subfamily [Paenibacillus sp. 453mf]
MESEKQWIMQIKKQSNKAAAGKLVSSYYKEIYSYVYKQTMDKEQSMDLTQEIFISMLQSIHYFDGKRASFRTWLYRIATNRVIDYYRSRAYRYRRSTEPIEEERYVIPEPEDFTIRVENREEVMNIMQVVSELEPGSQSIFRLKIFGEYTFLEIADMLLLPESTVKSKYYTMIRKIKKQLEVNSDV